MLEIEIKSPIENLEELHQKLIAIGAVERERRTERDTYYAHPCRDFSKTDEALRIRTCANFASLTYKGPKIGTKSKSRFEIEIAIDNPSSMHILLQKLGFSEVLCIEKERTIYTAKSITICIDRVANLGNFVEFEKVGEKREAIENELFAFAESLGISQFERKSYLELLLQKKHTAQ
ncbi:MAG: class IV adenylate cyclase [Spirochaetes bacterium]|nr:class IV adenylate cyclase [Spirochaetota bacterium]